MVSVELWRWIEGISISSQLGASQQGPKCSPSTVQLSEQFHKVVKIIDKISNNVCRVSFMTPYYAVNTLSLRLDMSLPEQETIQSQAQGLTHNPCIGKLEAGE